MKIQGSRLKEVACATQPGEKPELLTEVNRCVRCARCKEVCPAYRATHDERKVARGRLMVLSQMLSGELAPSPGVREVLDACLKCHQCADICPVGIDTVRLFCQGRSLLPGPGMRSFLTRLVFRLILPHRRLYDLFMRLARWGQKLMPRRAGGLRHLPLMFEGRRSVPELAKRPALSVLSERTGRGPRVAFYVGCLLNYVYADTASNAHKLLKQAGCEVIVPQAQLCCGLAALYAGDTKAARRLATHNASVFSECEAEYVVTACATCATMLKQEYPLMLGPGWAGGAQVMEITEFLTARGYRPQGRGTPVTYHDPCHMRFAQHVVEQPRRVLSAVAQVREPAEAGRCCGGGGTFSIYHYGLSREIGQAQAKQLKDTGAQTVATTCPGCMLQLADMLGGDMEVCHVVDFVARAISSGNRIERGDFLATEPRPVPS